MREKGVFCYGNKTTFEKHLRIRPGCQWTRPSDLTVGAFSPTPGFPENHRQLGRGKEEFRRSMALLIP